MAFTSAFTSIAAPVEGALVTSGLIEFVIDLNCCCLPFVCWNLATAYRVATLSWYFALREVFVWIVLAFILSVNVGEAVWAPGEEPCSPSKGIE